MLQSEHKPPSFLEIFPEYHNALLGKKGGLPKSVLITGAQGMLGNAIAEYFYKAISELHGDNALLLLASRSWPMRTKWESRRNCRLIANADITSEDSQVELIVHTASPSNITKVESREILNKINEGMLENLYALNPKKIVFISTGEVYGGEDLDEGSYSRKFKTENKRDWYPIEKIRAEESLRNWQLGSGRSVDIVRLFHTFGPGLKSNDGRSFADILWGSVLKNEIVLYSKGDQVRTFLYLSDAVEIIVEQALVQNYTYRLYNLGGTDPVTILDFAREVSRLTGARINQELSREFLHSPNSSIIPRMDGLRELAWKPKVALDEGLVLTLDYIRNSIQN